MKLPNGTFVADVGISDSPVTAPAAIGGNLIKLPDVTVAACHVPGVLPTISRPTA